MCVLPWMSRLALEHPVAHPFRGYLHTPRMKRMSWTTSETHPKRMKRMKRMLYPHEFINGLRAFIEVMSQLYFVILG